MTSSHSVSALICTKDRPQELHNCIMCVMQQSVLPAEIIIVDASDNDEPRAVVSSLEARHGDIPIKYFHTRAHHAFQKNYGIKECAGDIVLLLDDDIEIEKDFINNILAVFDSRSYDTIGGVCGNDTACLRTPRLSLRHIVRVLFFLYGYGNGKFRLSGLHTTNIGLKGIRKTEYLPGAYTAFRKSVLMDVGLLDDSGLPGGSSPFEDVDLSYRVSRKYQNYYTEFAHCVHKHSELARAPIDVYNSMIVATYPYYFRKNIPQNILTKFAYRLAMYGLKNKFYYMLDQDILLFFMRVLAGKRLTDRIIALKRKYFKSA